MKRILLLLALIIVGTLFAERISLGSESNSLQVLQSSAQETVLQYQIQHFDTKEVQIRGSSWYHISLPKEGVTQDKGLPELPVFNRSITIDGMARMKLEIFDIEYTDIKLAIAPSKGVITRNIDPATVPYEFDPVYQGNRFYPEKIATLSEPYILRDFRGITIKTTPFAYRPSSGTLRIYTSYKIRVYGDGSDTLNTMTQSRQSISRAFAPLYENHFVNYQNHRYVPVDDSYGKLLVICHTNFMSTILPWVNWKKQKGIETELVQWSTIGTTATQLQTYIQNRYNQDNSLTYVQIVGDAPQIPTLSFGGGGSDPSFSLVAGNDNYPDIFIGRFSAETTAQLSVQLDRSIAYERDAATSDTWLSRAMGIASDEGGAGGDNGETDIQHMNVIRSKLLSYGYSSVDQVYDPGASASTVSTNVNAGRGFLNYVGHGSNTTWSTTGFSATNAMNLSNGNKAPFIVDVACINGNFVSITCFAEGWMRSPNGGAITIYASSINQSWASPMRAQDEITDLWVAEAKNTAGGFYYNGSCKMMDIYGSDGINMFKTWHIFGDASLMARSKTPVAMTVTHPNQITIGAASMTVNTGVANALVALSYDNQVYARGFTNSSGTLSLPLGDMPAGSLDYTLTVTAHNRVTYVNTVQQIPGSGPYVVVENIQYADGNNQLPDYGENATLHVSFKNLGAAAATNLNATFSSTTLGITITDANEALGSLPAGAGVTRNNAFAFNIANNIPDGTIAEFNILMQSGSNSWNHAFTLEIAAPALSIGNFTIFDPSGNSNGMLDPGETVTFSVPILNEGGALSPIGSLSLSTLTSGITIISSGANLPAIPAGGSQTAIFTVSAAESMAQGTLAAFSINATAGAYTCAENISLEVGAPETITIGNGTSTQTYPLYRYYKYSTHEAIYLASEIGVQGAISSIGYYKDSGADVNPIEETSIYMKHSAVSSLSHGIYSLSGYTLVYSGAFPNNATSGWMEVDLSQRFDYDGISNLSILIVKGSQDWTSSYPWWTYTASGSARARQGHSDYAQPSSLNSTTNLPNLRLKIFQGEVVPVYNPPQNLTAIPGNQRITLNWDIPCGSVPSFYKVYRNSVLLGTVSLLTYQDNAVNNGTQYSYYVVAAYPEEDSEPSNTVLAVPGMATEVIIGNGTSVTSTSVASPINVYYKSMHGQSIYTASELNAAGMIGGVNISQLGFYVDSAPAYAMPDFIVRMKHTGDCDVINWQTANDMQTVYTNAAYLPGAGGYQMLTLSSPFLWNGVDNIVIDTAFGLLGNYHSSGTVQYTPVSNGYRYSRNDGSDQSHVFSGGFVSSNRPNVKLSFIQGAQDYPLITVSPSSISETVSSGSSVSRQITISNTGTEELIWSIPGRSLSSRNITGSSFSSDVDTYVPGSTATWTFTVNNGSPDAEWIKDIQITFPAAVTVNSVSSFTGGSESLPASPQSGTGVTINWHYESSYGYGGIHAGETASATVNVTISAAASGNLSLPWIVTGDDYGSAPHSFSDNHILSQAGEPQADDWYSLSSYSGRIAAGVNSVITITMDSEDMADATYNCSFTIASNAINSPSLGIPVSLTVFTPVNPYPVQPRFVAEWEPARGAIVRYPFGQPYSLLRDLSNDALLYVIVSSSSQSTANSNLQSNGVNMPNIRYVNAASDSYWVRDYSAWTIFDAEHNMHLVDFNYNRPRPNDNLIPAVLANHLNAELYDLDMNHTGGNMMTDGMGKAMSTTLVLSENSSLTPAQINQRFEDFLGVSDYFMYADPLLNSSIDHIDCHAKLLDVDKVMIARVPSGHANYSALEATAAYWQSQTSSYGTPYRVFRVNQSSNNEPYANSFILNNKIYVPQWNSSPSSYDTAAIAAYQAAMPGYGVQGFYDSSWVSDDAVHCRVNTIFDDQMIAVRHVPLSDLTAYQEYSFTVQIDHSNALAPEGSFIAWSTSSSGPWQQSSLSHDGANSYSASITTGVYLQSFYYWIQASDISGRVTTLPLCGGLDPFVAQVSIPNPDLPDWIPVNYPNPAATIHAQISFFGNPAPHGDLVGAFVDGECRGASLITNGRNTYISMQVQLAQNGETVKFKIFSRADGLSYNTGLILNLSFGENIGSDLPIHLTFSLDKPVVSISQSGSYLLLSWPAVNHAESYRILSADSPDGVFSLFAQSTATSLQINPEAGRRFYKVIAVKGEERVKLKRMD